MTSPHVQELELRFVEINHTVCTALTELLLQQQQQQQQQPEDTQPQRIWECISIVGCSGLSADLSSALPLGDCHLFSALTSALQHSRRLVFNHNNISYHGFCSLGALLKDKTNLTALHLKRDVLYGEHAHVLFEGLATNTTLRELVLNFCRFDAAGLQCLTRSLQQNSHIQALDMGACYLSDEQIEQLILALVDHPALQTLVLTLNSCHGRGTAALARLLSSPKCQLKALNLSHQKGPSHEVYREQVNGLTMASVITRRMTTISAIDQEIEHKVDVQGLAEAFKGQ